MPDREAIDKHTQRIQQRNSPSAKPSRPIHPRHPPAPDAAAPPSHATLAEFAARRASPPAAQSPPPPRSARIFRASVSGSPSPPPPASLPAAALPRIGVCAGRRGRPVAAPRRRRAAASGTTRLGWASRQRPPLADVAASSAGSLMPQRGGERLQSAAAAAARASHMRVGARQPAAEAECVHCLQRQNRSQWPAHRTIRSASGKRAAASCILRSSLAKRLSN